MPAYTLHDVYSMTFEQLGAVQDPFELMSTGAVSPMLLRYVVRNGQLHARYSDADLPALLMAINYAATFVQWPMSTVAQKAPVAILDPDVDAYLETLQPGVQQALDFIGKARGAGDTDAGIAQSLVLSSVLQTDQQN